jgi:hypothetical protein
VHHSWCTITQWAPIAVIFWTSETMLLVSSGKLFKRAGLQESKLNTSFNMGRSHNYGRNSIIFHITNGLNSLHRKWHTGNQYIVKSAENRMRSNLEGCRTFRNLVTPIIILRSSFHKIKVQNVFVVLIECSKSWVRSPVESNQRL